MAPDARIVSVKVGVADGGTDVSQVIAAIDWVVQHRNDGDLNIRVINLSYGTNSAQDSKVDPLAYAAERAWKAGIVVVAAGGNYGFQSHMNNAPALADPAIDRYVHRGRRLGLERDADLRPTTRCPAFSPWPKRGATRSVDLIAPGAHIQGLRVPNSYIDAQPPGGPARQPLLPRQRNLRVGGDRLGRRGARSSTSTRTRRPDQVKKLLTDHSGSTSAARPRRSAAASCSSRRP